MANEPSEKPCPDCGEMVRPNSVRCWNCGGFMRKDMAVKFQQMQMNPKPMGHLEMPQMDTGSLKLAGDDDDDFELSVPMNQSSAFSLPPLTPVTAAPPASQVRIEPPKDTSEIPALASPLGGVVAEALSPIPSLTPEGAKPAKSERPKSEDDALLDLVTQDINETAARRKKRNNMVGGVRTASGGFIIYCPYGCRFEVKDSNRGMSGKCPRCKAPFIVPIDPPDYSASKKTAAGAAEGVDHKGVVAKASDAAGAYSGWMKDLHLHTVSPDKLKLKADSLLKEFTEYDVAFSSDGLLLVNVAKKGGGLFGGGDKKKQEARDAMLQALKDGKPVAELVVADKQTFTADQIRQMRVVQPVANRGESMFAGIPVFGTGRIAVQLPFTDDAAHALPQYLSFSLSEFRTFAKALQAYGIENFGGESGAPVTDMFDIAECHITKAPIRILRNLDYYKADPTIKLVKAGYKCGACQLTISEAGRAKDNLGGKDGKAIAKQKCPKCQQKMGDNPLMSLDAADDTGQGNVKLVSGDDPKMQAALDKARSTVETIVAALKSPKPTQASFQVKKAFEDAGMTEHMWLSDVTIDGDMFSGTIGNEPQHVKNVKFGQKATVAKSEISDWMFIDDGKLAGGYSILAMRENMTPAERSSFDTTLPFKIG